MIGVIADDLTGAAEIAGIGWRHGLSAEVILDGRASREVALVCVDTDSRLCSPREAARRVSGAVASLRKLGANWIYKKVDSVLRGPVIAELEAAMKQLGFERVLLVPANPGLGRTIEHGNYFVKGRPLHRTDFAKDPQHPRTSADVIDLLGRTSRLPVAICRAGGAILKSGINVGEVATSRDLQWWATQGRPGILLAGGAEFFGALLEGGVNVRPELDDKIDVVNPEISRSHAPGSPNRRNTGATVTGSELFVCGSISRSTRAFVNAARRSGAPVFSIGRCLNRDAKFGVRNCVRIGRRVADALKLHPRVVVQIGPPIIRKRAIERRLTQLLARVAASAIRETPVSAIYAEGGATAVELARQMGWRRLKVMRELSPGVATFKIDSMPGVSLTIKPGSYLWPNELFQWRPLLVR